MPNVSFYNVSKTFYTTQALSQLSFECREGEVHALLGENGAGKSTLAGLLAGLYLPSDGEIRIADKPVHLHSPQKSLRCGIGVVFQHPLLVSELSVMENLLLGSAWWKLCNGKIFQAQYESLSNLLGINIDAQTPVKHLSLGEQQYIEIIRALWHKQKILVFDEATALLSFPEAQRLGLIMQTLAKSGHTILYITHKLREAIFFADRMTIVRQGKKVAEISPETIAEMRSGNNLEESEHNICRAIFGDGFDNSTASTAPTTSATPQDLCQNQSLATQELQSKTVDHTDSWAKDYADNYADNCSKSHSPFFEISCISSHTEDQVCSINDISFSIHGNEILGIAGIDGHGQKHLAEILAGQRSAKNGTISLYGQEITELSNAQRQKLGIHYVSEDRLNEGLAGNENIALNLQIKNLGAQPFWKYGIAKWKRIQKYAQEVMQALFIPQEHQASLSKNLSGGTIQKVILARELNQAKLCMGILHNPTHGLDVRTAKEIHEKIHCTLSQHCSFILISSDIDELLSLSTHLAVIKNGKLSDCFINNSEAYHTLTTLIAMD